VGDNRAPHAFAEFHLRLILVELTTAHQNRSALHLERVAAFLIVIPLNEGAVAKANGASAGDPGDLVAGPPKSAVYEAHGAIMVSANLDHGGVRAVKGYKFAIRDEQ